MSPFLGLGLQEMGQYMGVLKETDLVETLAEASASKDAGHLEAAEKLYRYVLQQDPQNSKAQKELHKLLKIIKKTTRKNGRPAKRKSKRARQQKPDLAAPRGELSQTDIQRLVSAHDRGQYDVAERMARRLTKRFPRAIVPFNILGLALAGQGKYEEAIESYDQALEINPDFAPVLNNRGVVLKNLGRFEESVACLRRAAEADPDFAAAHSNLGFALSNVRKHAEAAASSRQALKLDPDLVEAHGNLGNALHNLRHHEEALDCFLNALRLKPDYFNALNGFAGTLRYLENVKITDEMKGLFVRCLDDPRIDNAAVRGASQSILKACLPVDQEPDNVAFHRTVARDHTTRALLTAHLRNDLIADPALEKWLTSVRSGLLEIRQLPEIFSHQTDLEEELHEALARQGFNNEYLWHVSEYEKAKLEKLQADILGSIEGGSGPDTRDLYLLAAYCPLHKIEAIAQWAGRLENHADQRLQSFLRYVVLEPARESEIARDMEQLTSIHDDVSQAVQSQYEENPYPRWDSISAPKPISYIWQILDEIAPYRPALEPTSDTPAILVAGCGTGKQPIFTAQRILNSQVLAIDLSMASLAFAQRKAEELGVANIRFAQADILKLVGLADRFDLIECTGVLHHMADPEAGLEVLLGLLKPGGFLRLGLYSELARQHVVRFRKLLSDEKIEPSLDGIRKFRARLRSSGEKEAITMRNEGDFYATSTVRDLVFHVQEHRFTIPQISDLLERHQLEFLGFLFKNPKVKPKFLEQFPTDTDCLDLQFWHRFERSRPRTFAGMYQFWCRKSV